MNSDEEIRKQLLNEHKVVIGILNNFDSEKFFLDKMKKDREIRKRWWRRYGTVSNELFPGPR